MRVDLHTHTTASDGLLRPAELLARAREADLQVVAITDHDTAAGVREALAGVVPEGLEVVAGIEVSSEVGERELHVLGYFIDPCAEILLEYEKDRRRNRMRRLHAVLARLRAAGLEITAEEILAQPGGDAAPGRPHIARVLVAKGYCESVSDCFRHVLGRGGPGFVPYPKLAPAESVGLIEAAGGLAVIAHAALDDLDPVLDGLVAVGMRGIEVLHPEHDAAARARYEEYACRTGLLRTGGSDFHGLGVTDGGRLGDTLCPVDWLDDLRRAVRRK